MFFGYINVWIMVFLCVFEFIYNEFLYLVWKEYFIKSIGFYVFVKEDLEVGFLLLVIMMGMMVVKEFGDVKFW